MMLGVFASSITSGQIISRIGRYKIFPIMGTGAHDALRLTLLSRITVETLGGDGFGLHAGSRARTRHGHADPGDGRAERRRLRAAWGRDFRHDAVPIDRRRGRRGAFRGIFAYTLQGKISATATGSVGEVERSGRDRRADRAAALDLSDAVRRSLHPVFLTASLLAFLAFLLVLRDQGSAAPDQHHNGSR